MRSCSLYSAIASPACPRWKGYSLIAEATLQPVQVPQIFADALLFFVQRHRLLQPPIGKGYSPDCRGRLAAVQISQLLQLRSTSFSSAIASSSLPQALRMSA
jgi:hypothetical protein